MKEMIELIARSLVDYPDEVHVVELQGEESILYDLKVSKKDIGKIIGKKGNTVQAIRIILSAAAAKHRKKVTLSIIE